MGIGQGNTVASIVLGTVLALAPLAGHADCLDDAADYWGIPRTLSRAIAMQESGMRADAVGRNTNGSRDIGLMQINSSWLPRLARYGIKESDLFNACTNGYVGNWILADNIARLGFNWDAVGAYNAASPDKRAAYARKIYKSLMTIQATEPTRALR
ncbi:lytic transglycosylase domain-containing protein [Burkholderia gladioli]|nr:lytic transglycosylase domain-containing protein [Burkholderia gladioli]